MQLHPAKKSQEQHRHICRWLVGLQRLSASCYVHVQELIKESVLDYMQDRKLADACRTQVRLVNSLKIILRRKITLHVFI